MEQDGNGSNFRVGSSAVLINSSIFRVVALIRLQRRHGGSFGMISCWSHLDVIEKAKDVFSFVNDSQIIAFSILRGHQQVDKIRQQTCLLMADDVTPRFERDSELSTSSLHVNKTKEG